MHAAELQQQLPNWDERLNGAFVMDERSTFTNPFFTKNFDTQLGIINEELKAGFTNAVEIVSEEFNKLA